MEFDRVPKIAKYLSLIFFLNWVGRSLVWNFLPIFIENQVSSVFLVGVITSLPAIIPILLDIPTSNLVQRAGEKVVIFLGLLTQVTIPLFFLTATPLAIVIGKITEGLGKTLIWNGGWSLSLKSADEDIESQAVSVFLLGINLALIISPIIGGYLIASYGFPITFWLWIFTSFLAVVVFTSYVGLEGSKGFVDSFEDLFHRETYINDLENLKQNFSQLKLPYILTFLYSIIFSFYWLSIPLLLDQINADFVLMGVVFGVAATPKLFQFVFGEIADRIGRVETMAVLSLLLLPVMGALAFVDGILMIGVFFFIARTISSGMSPAVHALFDERCPEEIESEMTGFLEMSKHSGQAIGPVMAGTVASIWSLSASFIAAAVISGLILLVSVRAVMMK